MLAFKCDVCGKLFGYGVGGGTVAGSIPRQVIGGRLHYYPEDYDLCGRCASGLREAMAKWLSENLSPRR